MIIKTSDVLIVQTYLSITDNFYTIKMMQIKKYNGLILERSAYWVVAAGDHYD